MFRKYLRFMSRKVVENRHGFTVTIKKVFDMTGRIRRLMLTINLDHRLVLSLAAF